MAMSKEVAAMHAISKKLDELDAKARERVVLWLARKYQVVKDEPGDA